MVLKLAMFIIRCSSATIATLCLQQLIANPGVPFFLVGLCGQVAVFAVPALWFVAMLILALNQATSQSATMSSLQYFQRVIDKLTVEGRKGDQVALDAL